MAEAPAPVFDDKPRAGQEYFPKDEQRGKWWCKFCDRWGMPLARWNLTHARMHILGESAGTTGYRQRCDGEIPADVREEFSTGRLAAREPKSAAKPGKQRKRKARASDLDDREDVEADGAGAAAAASAPASAAAGPAHGAAAGRGAGARPRARSSVTAAAAARARAMHIAIASPVAGGSQAFSARALASRQLQASIASFTHSCKERDAVSAEDWATWKIAEFFVGEGIPLAKVDSKLFRDMVEAIRACKVEYEPPGRTALGTTHLNTLYERTVRRMVEALLASSAVAVSVDAYDWSTGGPGADAVTSYNLETDRGTFFLAGIDNRGEAATAPFLHRQFTEIVTDLRAMLRLRGPELEQQFLDKFAAVNLMADNAASLAGFRELLREDFPHVLVLGSAAQCMNLLAGNVCSIRWVAAMLADVTAVVEAVEASKHMLPALRAIRLQCEPRPPEFQKSVPSRWHSYHGLVHSFMANKEALRTLVNQSEAARRELAVERARGPAEECEVGEEGADAEPQLLLDGGLPPRRAPARAGDPKRYVGGVEDNTDEPYTYRNYLSLIREDGFWERLTVVEKSLEWLRDAVAAFEADAACGTGLPISSAWLEYMKLKKKILELYDAARADLQTLKDQQADPKNGLNWLSPDCDKNDNPLSLSRDYVLFFGMFERLWTKRWNENFSDEVMVAAAFLDNRVGVWNEFLAADAKACMAARASVIARLANEYKVPRAVATKLVLDYSDLRAQSWIFPEDNVLEEDFRRFEPPARWWGFWRNQLAAHESILPPTGNWTSATRSQTVAALCDLAIKISSIPMSSALCSRNWALWSFMHPQLRNHLTSERVMKVVFCYWNLRALNEPLDDSLFEEWLAIASEELAAEQLAHEEAVRRGPHAQLHIPAHAHAHVHAHGALQLPAPAHGGHAHGHGLHAGPEEGLPGEDEGYG
eukprot:tig00000681_g3058.t1